MNPFLQTQSLPQFSQFHVEHILEAIKSVLADNRAELTLILNQSEIPSWNNFVEPLERLENNLQKVWGPIRHLQSVCNTDDWHKAYTEALQLVTAYRIEFGQNQQLFEAYQSIQQSQIFDLLSDEKKRAIHLSVQSFELSGVGLTGDSKQRYSDISEKLSERSSLFSNIVLKATQSWHKLLVDHNSLSGIPESSTHLFKQNAEKENLQGWLITLDIPSYLAVMTYASDRALREEVYKAYVTRASDKFSNLTFDNSDVMVDILNLRKELASLLSFQNYTSYSLATKMADTKQMVFDFLQGLADHSKIQAQREYDLLRHFAHESDQIVSLESWDIPYYSEKLKQQTFAISQEELRSYFPIDQVLKGLFTITHTLFGIEIKENSLIDVWHQDVRYFELFEGASIIGSFYLDPYARTGKKGGAWMDSAITRWQPSNCDLQLPVAYLVCNFTPPLDGDTSYLTHNEVTTLFHEFGHGIHHLFSKQTILDISGINGVEWDAVELPSQFMENFCWEQQGIDLISSHKKTGESLPPKLLESLKSSRGFQSAMMMLRQIEFAMFDLDLHSNYESYSHDTIISCLNEVRKNVSVVQPPEYNRFANSFSHIFSGGYASGYYSYKWAEVLSADAFDLFIEKGILSKDAGQLFKHHILEKGGAYPAQVLYSHFRGREPSIEPLLRHSGIA